MAPPGIRKSGIRNQEEQVPDAWRLIYRCLKLVGLGRFELPTSRLSSARSNQLSYKPVPGISNQQSAISKARSDHCRLITDTWSGSSKKKEKRRRRCPANGHDRSKSACPNVPKRSDRSA